MMSFFRKHHKVFVKVIISLMILTFLISLVPSVIFMFQ